VTGLPPTPAWFGALYVVSYHVDDALTFFGMVRLAQIVGEAEGTRHQAADMAVARERMLAAGALQEAIGVRLADLAITAAAVRRVLPTDPTRPGPAPRSRRQRLPPGRRSRGHARLL
jgi:hypothetical protein